MCFFTPSLETSAITLLTPKSHAIRPLPPSLRTSAPFASLRTPFPTPGSSRCTAGRFKDHLKATPLRISPLECAVPRFRALSPLECAVTSKHRVLPGFGRSCPPVTPLECAVTQIDAVTPLECAVPKKDGGLWGHPERREGFVSSLFPSSPARHCPSSPLLRCRA